MEPAIVRSARERGKPGRKRYATKEEDELLKRYFVTCCVTRLLIY